MRESRAYLDFFKKHLLVIGVLTLLGLLASILYVHLRPDRVVGKDLFQINYDSTNIEQKMVLTDQVVALVRSEQFQESLAIQPNIQVSAYKPGPLLVSISTGGVKADSNTSLKALDLIKGKLAGEFSIAQIGETVWVEDSQSSALVILAGLFTGLATGILILLVIEYWRKY